MKGIINAGGDPITYDEWEYWSDASCSCHLHPPCGKCENTPFCLDHMEPVIDCGCEPRFEEDSE